METFTDIIRSLGTVSTIYELNTAYTAAIDFVWQMQEQGFWDGVADAAKLCNSINHVTNYNIIRVANEAYENYVKSGRQNTSYIKDILICCESIKEHENNSTEHQLLSDLCEKLNIN